ncbi:16S rRNA (guanine(966)-N(2))-methyltransferase RsmD [Effusibacillus lacus]|uniref:DNA methyltransferase n=1 Tax=Effusibacillus lacus TaxID=1348429 RepID=A0A292YNS0_9BACL|nr:16S rRNA (guanine(966)-N(2))-methyltransferase RsmD [Effusibacillus lacus]TCS76571.1 16S rRNA (guanine(966)-N(2))-methyltransferase RsmD [Effusibacillus lacus]GAX90413.1 DNA methyltransferase [Effusibacillus lacus]
MRVIAGDFKGRRLTPVPGSSTRPTTDKVKESIFNIIGPYFDGGQVLDLFAGTGALGIEALSRGMDRAVFIEQDAKALQVVRRNVDACKLESRADIYRNDARRAISVLAKRKEQFDLVFMDPPYHFHIIPDLAASLDRHDLLRDTAVIVAEHSKDAVLPDQLESLRRWKLVTYGDTSVSFYRKGTFTNEDSGLSGQF